MSGTKGRLSKSVFQITKFLALFLLTPKILIKLLREKEKGRKRERQYRHHSSVTKPPHGVLQRTQDTAEDPWLPGLSVCAYHALLLSYRINVRSYFHKFQPNTSLGPLFSPGFRSSVSVKLT